MRPLQGSRPKRGVVLVQASPTFNTGASYERLVQVDNTSDDKCTVSTPIEWTWSANVRGGRPPASPPEEAFQFTPCYAGWLAGRYPSLAPSRWH